MELLERDSFLRELDTALKDAVAGQGRVALVSGEAGIGKTSLVEHFTRGHKDSVRVLWGVCDSLFTPRPLGPLLDIAMQLEGKLPALLNSNADRQAIFSACLVELQNLPTIVVFEDVHWADEATLDLIKFLGRRIQRTASMFILTYRDDELSAEHPLRLVLGDLPRAATNRLQLLPLSKSSVFALARAADQAERAHELFDTTSGNPFFVTEALASKGTGMPSTVRDAVLARAARLSPSARAVLDAAAVIGLRVEPWLLSNIVGAESGSVEECISKGMLQAQGDYFAFRHELARQTILESISLQRKIALHQMTLNALKESSETRIDLVRLANHAEGTKDAGAVLEYAPTAAQQAAAAGSHREAVALYELALRFAEVLPSDEHAQMLEDYEAQLVFTDRMTDEIIVLQKAIELWHSIGNRLREGRNLAKLAGVYLNVRRNTESEEAIQSAIAMLEKLPPSAELAQACKDLCYIKMMYRDCAEAIIWGEKAIALAERFEDANTFARTCNYMGCAALIVDYKRGLELFERSLAIAREENLPFAVAGTLGNLGGMLLEVRDIKLANHYLAQGIGYAAEHDDDFHLLEIQAWQALAYMYQGHWAEAADIARTVLQRSDTNVTRTGALFVLGRLGIRRGDTSARILLDEALSLSILIDSPRFDSPRLLQAEAAWLAGNYQPVLEETRLGYNTAVKKQHPWIAGEFAFWRWRSGDNFTPPPWIARPFALQIAGNWREAAKEWEERGCPYEQAMALMDGDEAAQLAALEIFERLGAKPAIEKLKQKMRAEGVHGVPRGPRPATRENPFGLTARELEVLACVVNGLNNNAIARKLSLSTRTVEHHIASILQKMQVQSRNEAVALALKENVVPSE